MICEVLKSKLKMLFTSFEKNDLFVHCLMHLFSYEQWVEILKKGVSFYKRFHDILSSHPVCVLRKEEKKISHQNTKL